MLLCHFGCIQLFEIAEAPNYIFLATESSRIRRYRLLPR